MKVEQIIMLVIAFLLGYQFKNICGQKVVEGATDWSGLWDAFGGVVSNINPNL
jgi:hypothetical protein